MTEKFKHTLTKEQARRLGVGVQEVFVVLKTEREKYPDSKDVPIAKDVFSLDGERLGGTLNLTPD